MDKMQQIKLLAQALDFYEYKRNREAGFAEINEDPTDKILRMGIGDLDFDPDFFLGTGQESPEGWAVKKK